MSRIMDESFWDERYRSKPAVWSGNPNPHLVAEIADLTPGLALDVGSGEGADTIWLADRGWQVTAMDLSSVALARGRDRASGLAVGIAEKITWLHADLAEWDPPIGKFDLVSLQFMHMPSAVRDPIYRRLAESVSPGGILLIVGHHPSDLDTTVRRPPNPDLLFTADELAEKLDENWSILAQDVRPRETLDPTGDPVEIHDSVLLAMRKVGSTLRP